MSKLDQLRRDWNDLAEIDPLWAICSDSSRAHGKWNIDDFFKSGQGRVNHFLSLARQSGVPFETRTALDFGCGVGRLTQELAREFEKCFGVDISPEMIRLAHQYNRCGERCEYVLNDRNDLSIFDDCSFDLIISDIVLQHVTPDLMKGYIVEFVRTLKPKGVLVFQLPIERILQDGKSSLLKKLPRYHPKRLLNVLRGILVGHNISDRYYRLRRLRLAKKWLYDRFGFRPKIEMHVLSESDTRDILTDLGAQVVRVEKSPKEVVLSAVFVVTK